MTAKLTDHIEAGRALDADEREIAALALQRVSEAEEAGVAAAWDEAIDRRLDELMSGRVKPVSGRETIAIARARSVVRRERLSTGTSNPRLVRSFSTPTTATWGSRTAAVSTHMGSR